MTRSSRAGLKCSDRPEPLEIKHRAFLTLVSFSCFIRGNHFISTGESLMKTRTASLVGARYEFYRDGFRASVGINIILGLAIVALLVGLFLALTNRPEPKYFAVENGQLIPIVPVSSPYVKRGDMSQWVARAVNEIYMLDFQNYRTRIEDNAQYFTPEGFEDYKQGLQDSGRLNMIREGWFVASAVPTAPPVIVQEGVVAGHYMWRVRVPIVVSYASRTHSVPDQNLMLTITIRRVQTYENPYAIGITQIVERRT